MEESAPNHNENGNGRAEDKMSVMSSLQVFVTPVTVWTAYRVGLHVVAFFAFASLFFQTRIFHRLNVPEWRLVRAKENLGQWRAIRLYPTLLWLNSSQKTSNNICGTAMLLNLFGCLGLVASWKVYLFSYIAYLSMDVVFDLHLPWDLLLLETLFWSSLLPGDPNREPAVPVALILRCLFLKLMLGFAKTKFVKARTSLSKFYIREFLVAIPIPTRLGLLLHRYAPAGVFPLLLAAMAVSEIMAPVVGIMPYLPLAARLFAFLSCAFLMVGITLTGSFGHFNLLTTVLALPQLISIEHDFERFYRGASPLSNDWFWAIPYCLLCLVQMNVGSAISTGWPFFFDEVMSVAPSRLVCRVAAIFRLITPFRICNSYGVFPPHSFFPARALPILEVEFKGKWVRLKFPYLPASEADAPNLIHPGLYFHTPRLEMKMFYLFRGMSYEGLEAAIVRADDPHAFAPDASLLDRLGQRLLEGDIDVVSYFTQHTTDVNPGLYRASKVRIGWALFLATGTHVKLNALASPLIGPYYTTLSLPGFVFKSTGRDADVWDAFCPHSLLYHFSARIWLDETDVVSAAKYVAASISEEEENTGDEPSFIPPPSSPAREDIVWSRVVKRFDGKHISESLVGISRQDVLDALSLLRPPLDLWENERDKLLQDEIQNGSSTLKHNWPKQRRIQAAANLLIIAKAQEIGGQVWPTTPCAIRAASSWWQVSHIAQTMLVKNTSVLPESSSAVPDMWCRIYPEMYRRRALLGKVARQVLDPLNYRSVFEEDGQVQATPLLKDRKSQALARRQSSNKISPPGGQPCSSGGEVNLSAFMDVDGSWSLL